MLPALPFFPDPLDELDLDLDLDLEEAEDLDLEDDLDRLDLELLELAEELRDFDLDLSESEPELLESCLIRPMPILAADILKIGQQNEFNHNSNR